MFAVLLGGTTALLPIVAKDILHTGPWGLRFITLCSSTWRITRHVGVLSTSSISPQRGENLCLPQWLFLVLQPFYLVYVKTLLYRCCALVVLGSS